jgi:hypothetical protein
MVAHRPPRLILAMFMLAITGAFKSTNTFAAEKPSQEFYELRIYRNTDPAKQEAVVKYLEGALAPALNRMGIDRVGIFKPTVANDASVYVLLPFGKLDLLSELNDKLEADADYQKAAEEFLGTALMNPPYTRIESRLMKAFRGMPVLALPEGSKSKEPRVFELRIYESHNDAKARRKVAMFNEGEIDIMVDAKMGPVFFGETLVSQDVPNLTYMLSAKNPDEHKEHWQTFIKHPEWQKMKSDERYKDTVSKITSVMLIPTSGSQI